MSIGCYWTSFNMSSDWLSLSISVRGCIRISYCLVFCLPAFLIFFIICLYICIGISGCWLLLICSVSMCRRIIYEGCGLSLSLRLAICCIRSALNVRSRLWLSISVIRRITYICCSSGFYVGSLRLRLNIIRLWWSYRGVTLYRGVILNHVWIIVDKSYRFRIIFIDNMSFSWSTLNIVSVICVGLRIHVSFHRRRWINSITCWLWKSSSSIFIYL